jgi:hypothetical protein
MFDKSTGFWRIRPDWALTLPEGKRKINLLFTVILS